MGNKSLADRILFIQNHCKDNNIDIDFYYDSTGNTWTAYENDEDQVTEPADSFEEMIDGLEAVLEI